MPFPPIPRELSTNWPIPESEQLWACIQNINALFLYLQRMRDQNVDEVSTIIENDPTLGGSTFTDSFTIDFTTNGRDVTAEVLNDTGIQKVEVAKDDILLSVRKRLNFSGGVTVLDNPATNAADVSITSSSLSRVVEESLIIHNTECIISSRYFDVQGILELQGDAALEIL